MNTITRKQSFGFTINEFVIVMVMLTFLGMIVVSNFDNLLKKSDADAGAQEFANVLRLAQSRTVSSESSSQYGVYLNTAVTPHQYVLFQGTSYAARNASEDQTYNLPKNAEFFNISLGGPSEVTFNRLTGNSNQAGNVTVRSKIDATQTKLVYIDNSGIISFSAVSPPSDLARVKDSRHLHFDYSRVIDTLTENITLNFNNGQVVQTFPINAFLAANQIEWLKTISVGGVNQTVKIHTHRLNSPDTQFSIHRDRRFNTTPLAITISGDLGSMAEYSADGSSTIYNSIYVSNFQLQ